MRNVALTAGMLALVVTVGHGQTATSSSSGTAVTVYKQVGCGCCTIWADHLRKAGAFGGIDGRTGIFIVIGNGA